MGGVKKEIPWSDIRLLFLHNSMGEWKDIIDCNKLVNNIGK